MESFLTRYTKIPLRQRIMAFVGIVLFVLFGHWYFIYSAQADKLVTLEEQYTKLETERIEKQAYAENLAKYEARLNELKESLNMARSQLPDDPDVPQLLAQLGDKGKQAGLDIDRFEPKGESPRDFYAEIAFNMNVHGSFHEIGTFLDAIGKLDRILNVTGLSMTNPRMINQKVIVDCSFVIKTYRFIEKAETAKKGGQP